MNKQNDEEVKIFVWLMLGFGALIVIVVVIIIFFSIFSFRIGNESVDSVPVQPTVKQKSCIVAGCSNQLCVEKGGDISSTCEFKEEYACYSKTRAVCEVQGDGNCGWTPSDELTLCIKETRKNSG